MRTTLGVIVALVAIVLLPSSASAAVCAQYANQAQAQAAADTVDADHDGIYCESLPCPCSTAAASRVPAPTAPSPPPAVGPQPPPPASLAPSTASSTSGTQLLTYSPFAVDGRVAGGLTVVSRSGECWIGSEKAAGAYRCTAGNQIRDPCYASPADEESVVCATAPWNKTVVRITLTDALPEPATPDVVPRVWALQLVAANRRCSWLSGGTLVVRGLRLNYACGSNRYLFGSPRTGKRFWKIRLSHGVKGTGMRLASIKRGWR